MVGRVFAGVSFSDNAMVTPYAFGEFVEVSDNLKNNGFWKIDQQGYMIWEHQIYFEEATSLTFLFSEFYLPENAVLTIMSMPSGEMQEYTFRNNTASKVFSTLPFQGNKAVLKYKVPIQYKDQARLQFWKIVKGNGNKSNIGLKTNSGNDCLVDAVCIAENETIDVLKERLIHSVVRIMTGNTFCTGTLINNTANDGRMLLLTANHCLEQSNIPPEFWVFGFNFFNDDEVCGDPDFETFKELQFANGAKLLANNPNSDFALFEILGDINPNWDLEWAGWSLNDVNIDFSFSLHHPLGEPTKISIENDQLVEGIEAFFGTDIVTWNISERGSGWETGTTLQGSSGAALFNQKGQIIGQLAGGEAGCNSSLDNDLGDFYSKIDRSWDFDLQIDRSLKSWLDPEGTGVKEMNSLSKETSRQGEGISIFPTPAIDTLILSPSIQGSYAVYTMNGVRIISNNNTFIKTIDISTLSSGIYILEIISKSGSKTIQKFIKN